MDNIIDVHTVYVVDPALASSPFGAPFPHSYCRLLLPFYVLNCYVMVFRRESQVLGDAISFQSSD
jgi:hypothetical protein